MKYRPSKLTKTFAAVGLGITIVLAAFSVGLSLNKPLVQPTPTPPPRTESVAVASDEFEKGSIPDIIVPDEVGIELSVSSQGYYPNSNVLLATYEIGEEYPKLFLVDNQGEVLRSWVLLNKHGGIIGDRRVLDNGNILFTVMMDGTYEIDPDGHVVWHYFDDTVTHHAEVITLDGRKSVMTVGAECDCVKVIDYETKDITWEWDARQAFPSYNTDTYIGADFTGSLPVSAYADYDLSSGVFPKDWTHINYAQYLPRSETFIVSLRSFDLILELNRDKEIVWSFGPGVIKHQHYPRVLPDGTMLVYDNGNGRVIRITRDHAIVWEYSGMYIPFLGDNNLLEDGNLKIVQSVASEASGDKSEVRVVDTEGNLLWSLNIHGRHMYRAHMPGLE